MKDNKLIKIYDKHITAPRPPITYKQKPKFRPSMIGTPCMRKLFYSYNNVPEDYPFPPENKKKMDLGDYIHLMLCDRYRKTGNLIDYHNKDGSVPRCRWTGGDDLEFPLKDIDLEISAKIDAVLDIDNELWLGEWKSINERGFKALKDKPKDEHLIQGILYLYLFNRALQEGKYKHIKRLDKFDKVTGVRFIYYNKNTSEKLEFVYTEHDKLFMQIINKMSELKEFTANNILPPTKYDWCKTCGWRKKCVTNQIK